MNIAIEFMSKIVLSYIERTNGLVGFLLGMQEWVTIEKKLIYSIYYF